MFKMILTDLDRTLFTSTKEISSRTQRAIEAARARGILFGVATGRSTFSCTRMTQLLRPDIMITNGGGLAMHGETVVYSCMLDVKTTNALLAAAACDPSVDAITMQTPQNYYTNQEDFGVLPEYRDYGHAIFTDFTSLPDEPAYKVTLSIQSQQAAQALHARFPQCMMIPFSGETWVCYAHPEATKDRALHAICAACGFTAQDVVAFGDDYNDISMLRACGIGVAMGNAIDEVKAAAKKQTATNDEDGIAQWIEKNILK